MPRGTPTCLLTNCTEMNVTEQQIKFNEIRMSTKWMHYKETYFSARLTSSGEIPALNKMFLHSERQLLVLRLESNHPNRQRLAQYGNHQHSPTKLLLVSGQRPKLATPDK